MLNALVTVFTPIFYGIAIAYILNPIMVFFERLYAIVAKKVFKIKNNKYQKRARTASVILSIIVLFALLWLLISSILPQLYNTVLSLINYIPDGFDKLKEWYDQFVQSEPQWLSSMGISVETILENIEKWFTDNLASAANYVLQYITSGIVGAVSFVTNLILGVCVAVYVLFEKHTIFAHIKKTVYAMFKKSRADAVVNIGVHTKNIFNGYIYGRILGCLVVFAATFIFMLIMNMPYGILISTVVGVTNFIPFFGPFIGAIPSVLILLIHDPIMGISFTIFTLILQQIEGNLITPLITSDTTGVSPFWVTVAFLVGGGFFGLLGLILSVPVFSVIYYIVKVLVERKLQNKALPVATDAYMTNNDFNTDSITEKLGNILKSKKKNKTDTDKKL